MQIREPLQNLYVIFSLAGFLISSTLPAILGIQMDGVNILYRLVVLGLAATIVIMSFGSKEWKYSLSHFKLFFVFWAIYSLFLSYDIYIEPMKLAPNRSHGEYVQFAFGVVLLPSIALATINFSKLNWKGILNTTYLVLFILLVSSLLFRNSQSISGRNLGDLEIGVLVYGQYGTMLALLSIIKFVEEKKGLLSILYAMGLITGIMIIFVSASRSPFVALLLSVLYFFIMRNGLKAFIYLAIPGFLISIFFFQIMSFFGSITNSNFLQRLTATFENDSGREKLFNVALNEFLDNPFFGKSILIQSEPYIGAYPHNLFIEALMATGFFGGTILILLFLKTIFQKGKYIIINNHSTAWVPVVLFQFFVFSMFSNNIFSNNLLWYLLVLTIMAYKYEKSLSTTNNISAAY